MNPDMLVTPDYVSVLTMENMNAGFVAEGLTSRKRAIARYMETKATKDDRTALKLLQDLEALTPSSGGKVWKESYHLLEKLGHLVGAADVRSRPTRPEASPLALYALALCTLESRFGQYNPKPGWGCLWTALELECAPARGLYADMALRTPLAPEDTKIRNTLQDFIDDALVAMNKDIFEAVDEDLLLVTGRRFALCGTGKKELARLVQMGLVLLAQKGHVDAVRLLALDHAHDPSPETLWAREHIREQADKGEAYAMLVMGQHLTGRYGFWLPEGDLEENLKAACDLLEKCARTNDSWAALTLAYTYLHKYAMEDAPEDQDDYNRALNMLETLAHDRDFAPAKAILGAWHCTAKQDPEAAWPLLRDACAQMFSRQCEAACADFLTGTIVNSMYVEAAKAGGAPRLDGFNDHDHGGTNFWLKERMEKIAQYERFGHITLAAYRLLLTAVAPKDMDDKGMDDKGMDDKFNASQYPDGLSRPEKRAMLDVMTGITLGGRLAVHIYLLQLATENTLTAQVLREHVKVRILADMADGNEDSIMTEILFTKRLFDANPCTAIELERRCRALGTASNIARTALTILHIHMLVENAEDGLWLDDKRLAMEMYVLEHEYMRAVQSIDLPVLCVLPVLFKYARRQFSSKVVRKSIEFVTESLFDGKRDLKGLVAEVNDIPYTWDLDMDHLWENLGLVPNSDFTPRGMHGGYEASVIRAQTAQARKDARRMKDKLKKAERKKARRRKR